MITQELDEGPLSPEEVRNHRAFHEAGHAVAALALGLEIGDITIIPDGKHGGSADLINPAPQWGVWNRVLTMNLIVASLAGKTGEAWGCEGTILQGGDARDVRDTLLLVGKLTPSESEKQALLQEARTRADNLFETHPWCREALVAVAGALLSRKRLSGADVREIVREAKRAVSKGE